MRSSDLRPGPTPGRCAPLSRCPRPSGRRRAARARRGPPPADPLRDGAAGSRPGPRGRASRSRCAGRGARRGAGLDRRAILDCTRRSARCTLAATSRSSSPPRRASGMPPGSSPVTSRITARGWRPAMAGSARRKSATRTIAAGSIALGSGAIARREMPSHRHRSSSRSLSERTAASRTRNSTSGSIAPRAASRRRMSVPPNEGGRGGLAGFGPPFGSGQTCGETNLSSRPRAAHPAEPVSLP